MLRLAGKTAIVTGAASGFGEGIVRKFIEQGASVMIVDINGDAATRLANELGANALALQANVAIAAEIEALSVTASKNFDKIDIVVNNAGITHPPKAMEDVTEEEFDRVFAVNSKSVFLTAKYLLPQLKANPGSNILNVASTGGVSPRPRLSWYNASKGWMNTATKAMAVELAPAGVRVNAINPVAGETPLLKSFMGGDTPEIREKFMSVIPLGRFSTPADMGNAACYLCSDEASMVTGVCMEVDGGRCI